MLGAIVLSHLLFGLLLYLMPGHRNPPPPPPEAAVQAQPLGARPDPPPRSAPIPRACAAPPSNLLTKALRYTGCAHVALEDSAERLVIVIRDEGPDIPDTPPPDAVMPPIPRALRKEAIMARLTASGTDALAASAAGTTTAGTLSSDQISNLFSSLDSKGDGSLSAAELTAATQSMLAMGPGMMGRTGMPPPAPPSSSSRSDASSSVSSTASTASSGDSSARYLNLSSLPTQYAASQNGPDNPQLLSQAYRSLAEAA